jgi:hypothetical protein
MGVLMAAEEEDDELLLGAGCIIFRLRESL